MILRPYLSYLTSDQLKSSDVPYVIHMDPLTLQVKFEFVQPTCFIDTGGQIFLIIYYGPIKCRPCSEGTRILHDLKL